MLTRWRGFSDSGVRLSLTEWATCWNLTDVTLDYEDTNTNRWSITGWSNCLSIVSPKPFITFSNNWVIWQMLRKRWTQSTAFAFAWNRLNSPDSWRSCGCCWSLHHLWSHSVSKAWPSHSPHLHKSNCHQINFLETANDHWKAIAFNLFELFKRYHGYGTKHIRQNRGSDSFLTFWHIFEDITEAYNERW